ncbi:MAG: efflux RND transporter periplasmic adaptor subunit [Burkholderiales bacterium]
MTKILFDVRPAVLTCAISGLAVALTACAPATTPSPVVQQVYVSPVRNDSGAAQRVLFGSVRPRVEADLSFRAGGKVTERLVELGQSVRAGQVLARIDPVDYQLAVQAATEQQRAAEVDAVQSASDAARFKRLLADGSVGAADAERQQARADAAAARLVQAQKQSELALNRAGYAVLTAPFDGVVTSVRFEAGQLVDDRQPVVSLARPGELEIVVDIPESLVANLRAWQASALLGNSADLTPGRPMPLRLRELAPSANPATRTTRARYALGAPAAGRDLRMGMSAEVRLQQAGGVSGADLPVGALLVTNSNDKAGKGSADATIAGPSVWLVDAKTGALKRQAVQLLSQSTDQVRVAGLADGALVVSVGAQKLDAGLKVQPVQRPLAAPSAATNAAVTR